MNMSALLPTAGSTMGVLTEANTIASWNTDNVTYPVPSTTPNPCIYVDTLSTYIVNIMIIPAVSIILYYLVPVKSQVKSWFI